MANLAEGTPRTGTSMLIRASMEASGSDSIHDRLACAPQQVESTPEFLKNG